VFEKEIDVLVKFVSVSVTVQAFDVRHLFIADDMVEGR